jgi:serine/threonine protein kinase
MPTPGRLVAGRYTLERPVARGGSSDVWLAADSATTRPVAVKVLRDHGLRLRFGREAEVLRRLEHPNIVHLLDAGRDGEEDYLVLEYVDGETLEARLRRGPIDPETVALLGSEVAGALAVAHGAGVVHRDVKPSNILLDGLGMAHLSDFGVAHGVDDPRITTTLTTVGTPAYLAPEQLTDSHVGPPADVYSLGLVLLECLTGRPAFTGSMPSIAVSRVVRDPEIPRTLPWPWPRLLQDMTARDESARPTAAAVVARLDPEGAATLDALAPVDVAATAVMPTWMPSEPKPLKRRAALLGTLGAVPLLITAALGVSAAVDHGSGDGPRPTASTTTSSSTTTSLVTTTTTAAPAAGRGAKHGQHGPDEPRPEHGPGKEKGRKAGRP